MDSCCKAEDLAIAAQRSDQRRVLVLVLAINLVMFAVEAVAGLIASSTALLADSLDMFGDSVVYGFSLYVVAGSVVARGRAAIFKGSIMVAFGLLVFLEAAGKIEDPTLPASATMGMIAAIALVANAVCFLLLYRHRADGLNMRSTWLCSRNDLIANAAVIAAAMMVARTGSGWPDLIVGISIAGLFTHSGWSVLRAGYGELIRSGRQPEQLW
ncbi:MAG TPA: cation transporter [Terriglobales bacterium]|nr:cation transporter [Terriglobales bacterium]